MGFVGAPPYRNDLSLRNVISRRSRRVFTCRGAGARTPERECSSACASDGKPSRKTNCFAGNYEHCRDQEIEERTGTYSESSLNQPSKSTFDFDNDLRPYSFHFDGFASSASITDDAAGYHYNRMLCNPCAPYPFRSVLLPPQLQPEIES